MLNALTRLGALNVAVKVASLEMEVYALVRLLIYIQLFYEASTLQTWAIKFLVHVTILEITVLALMEVTCTCVVVYLGME